MRMNQRTALISLALCLATNMANAQTPKVYEIDRNITYQVIVSIPARSVVTVVTDLKAKK